MSRFTFTILAGLVLLFTPLSSAVAENPVEVSITRIDDFVFPSDQYSLEVLMELDGAGITAVSVTAAGGTIDLEEFPPGSGEWEQDEDLAFANLAALQAATNGT